MRNAEPNLGPNPYFQWGWDLWRPPEHFPAPAWCCAGAIRPRPSGRVNSLLLWATAGHLKGRGQMLRILILCAGEGRTSGPQYLQTHGEVELEHGSHAQADVASCHPEWSEGRRDTGGCRTHPKRQGKNNSYEQHIVVITLQMWPLQLHTLTLCRRGSQIFLWFLQKELRTSIWFHRASGLWFSSLLWR